MKKIVAIVLSIFPIALASAADCNNVQTQFDMNQCALADYQKADKELNSIYQLVLKQTSGEKKHLLQYAQSKWINYRDADCTFQTFKFKDGSVNSMNAMVCLQAKTEQRTKELNGMLNCPEGDVTCPL